MSRRVCKLVRRGPYLGLSNVKSVNFLLIRALLVDAVIDPRRHPSSSSYILIRAPIAALPSREAVAVRSRDDGGSA